MKQIVAKKVQTPIQKVLSMLFGTVDSVTDFAQDKLKPVRKFAEGNTVWEERTVHPDVPQDESIGVPPQEVQE